MKEKISNIWFYIRHPIIAYKCWKMRRIMIKMGEECTYTMLELGEAMRYAAATTNHFAIDMKKALEIIEKGGAEAAKAGEKMRKDIVSHYELGQKLGMTVDEMNSMKVDELDLLIGEKDGES